MSFLQFIFIGAVVFCVLFLAFIIYTVCKDDFLHNSILQKRINLLEKNHKQLLDNQFELERQYENLYKNFQQLLDNQFKSEYEIYTKIFGPKENPKKDYANLRNELTKAIKKEKENKNENPRKD